MAFELPLSRYGTARRAFAGGTAADFAATEHAAARAVEAFNMTASEAALAAEIVAFEPPLPDEEREGLFALVLATRVFLARGSTRVPVSEEAGGAALEGVIETLLGDGNCEAVGRVLAVIRRMLERGGAPHVIGGPDDYRPLVHDAPFVSPQRMFVHEGRLVGALGKALARTPPGLDDSVLERAVALASNTAGIGLNVEQTAAVRTALGRSFSLISGGPGTGKTSIVAAILHGLQALGVPPESIALAAPTGKAAWRMTEAVGQSFDRAGIAADDPLRTIEACTLHRLLGYLPAADRFRNHRLNPLAEQVVIVDEASMIDVFMMERLVAAGREDGRLVLLGDADQLPSVDAGAVFRDLAAAAENEGPTAGRVVRLEENFRMRADDPAGKAILETAGFINRGDATGLAARGGIERRARPEALAFDGVEAIFDPEPGRGLEAFLRCWYEHRGAAPAEFAAAADRIYAMEHGLISAEADRTSAAKLLDHLERSRVLCLTHRYRTGTEAVNASLHRRHARLLGRATSFEVTPGEPLMMLHNDYERGLFNGDAGVALMGRNENGRVQLHAVFRRGPDLVAHPFALLRPHLDLAWALTVHKSQGSEFDAVALILPEQDIPLLTRDLLYTAVTRSRKSVVFHGPEERLHTGIERRIERYSGVGERLRE